MLFSSLSAKHEALKYYVSPDSMIKQKPYGDTLKAQLKASAADRLHTFLLADGTIRGVILYGTRMVNEMRANHDLGIMETLVLGRAYLGIGLMSSNLKGDDQIRLQIDCSGPIKGLLVEANAFGEVRGFLKQVPIPIASPVENFDLSKFFGAGFLSVIRRLKSAKQPFTGQVELKYGNLALDLANYYLTSEQIPSAFNLSIKFDRQGRVTGAGGLLLQAMPEAREHIIVDLEKRVNDLPSLGEAFGSKIDPEKFIYQHFEGHGPQFLANRRVEFMCHCNVTRLKNLVTLFPIKELKDMVENGPFPLEVRCQFCNTPYTFSRADLQRIYGQRFPDN